MKKLIFFITSFFFFSIFFLSIGYSYLNTVLSIESSGIIDVNDNVDYSMYSWYDIVIKEVNINNTINRLKELNIKDLYQSFGSLSSITSASDSITKLSDNNIDTYYLTGKAEWYSQPDLVKEKIDIIYTYNNSVSSSSELIKGIVLDIEPYVLDEFKLDAIGNFEIFADTLEDVYEYAIEKDLEMITVIPFWYDKYITDDTTYNEGENQRAQVALEKIISNSSKISVMNYQKTNMVENIATEVSIAREYNVQIESIAEFARPEGEDIPESISLWVEEDPINYANQRWNEILDEYDYSRLGFSYHYLNLILEILGDYETLTFEFKDESNNLITSGTYSIIFSNGDTSSKSVSSSITVPKDVEYLIRLDSYRIISQSMESLGDNVVKVICVVEELESYTLEIYPKVDTNGTGEYTSLQTGTVMLYDKTYNTTKEVVINSGYAVFSNVYSDTEYSVVVTDSNGIVYELVEATAKDEDGVNQTINNEDNNIIIPTGFKSSFYVVPVLKLKLSDVNTKIYSVDIHPMVYDEDTSEYVEISSGDITLVKSTGDEQSSCSISENICTVYNIESNYSYKLSFTQNSYSVTKITGINSSNEVIELSNNDSFTIPTSFHTEDNIDIYVYFSIVDTSDKIYTSEIYSYLQDSLGGSYTALKSGQISVTNNETNEIQYCTIDSTGYYCILSNIEENTSYSVKYLDNEDYEIISITANDDDGNAQVVSDTSGNMIIPSDFITDDYLIVKFYFKDPNVVLKEKYSITVYLRDVVDSSNIRIDNTSISLTNNETNEVIVSDVLVDSDGNYIYYFENILSDTVYSSSVDLGDQSYSFSSIQIKDESGSYVSINNGSNNQFIIPTGTKSSLSANVRFYLNLE